MYSDSQNLAANLNKAVYSSDLLEANDSARFVQWGGSTLNTPYTAGLTSSGEGFAFCFGNYTTYQSVLCFAKDDNRLWAWSKPAGNWIEYAQKNDLNSGYLQLKVLNAAVRVFTIEVSFQDGIGYIPFSQLFEGEFKPTTATAVPVPIALDDEIVICGGFQDGDNMKFTMSRSYTGIKWVTSIVVGTL